ncbi:MAG: hypothetical protein QM764_20595 [Chitinophagaceae bacterium]
MKAITGNHAGALKSTILSAKGNCWNNGESHYPANGSASLIDATTWEVISS